VAPGILFLAPLAIPLLLLIFFDVFVGVVVWEDHKEGYYGSVTSRHVPTLGRVMCMKSSTGVPSLLWRFASQGLKNPMNILVHPILVCCRNASPLSVRILSLFKISVTRSSVIMSAASMDASSNERRKGVQGQLQIILRCQLESSSLASTPQIL